MKRPNPVVSGIAALFLSITLFQAVPVFAADTGNTTIEGTLVDVACASENAAKPKEGFAMKHSKDCLQMPDCAKSGYAVVTPENKVIHFDAKGNQLAKELIEKSDKQNDFKVSVKGKVSGDGIAVTSLNLE